MAEVIVQLHLTLHRDGRTHTEYVKIVDTDPCVTSVFTPVWWWTDERTDKR